LVCDIVRVALFSLDSYQFVESRLLSCSVLKLWILCLQYLPWVDFSTLTHAIQLPVGIAARKLSTRMLSFPDHLGKLLSENRKELDERKKEWKSHIEPWLWPKAWKVNHPI